jgi:hypothetical protein
VSEHDIVSLKNSCVTSLTRSGDEICVTSAEVQLFNPITMIGEESLFMKVM